MNQHAQPLSEDKRSRINRIRANGETLFEAEARVAVADALLHNHRQERAAHDKSHLPALGPVSIGSYRKRRK